MCGRLSMDIVDCNLCVAILPMCIVLRNKHVAERDTYFFSFVNSDRPRWTLRSYGGLGCGGCRRVRDGAGVCHLADGLEACGQRLTGGECDLFVTLSFAVAHSLFRGGSDITVDGGRVGADLGRAWGCRGLMLQTNRIVLISKM